MFESSVRWRAGHPEEALANRRRYVADNREAVNARRRTPAYRAQERRLYNATRRHARYTAQERPRYTPAKRRARYLREKARKLSAKIQQTQRASATISNTLKTLSAQIGSVTSELRLMG
jgi:hypothetical protein